MPSATTRRPGRPPGSQGGDLLVIARAMFLERGFEGTTMQEIAAAARVSKTSLYREHPSKSALFVSVVSDWTARGRGAMRPHVDLLLAADDLPVALLEFAQTLLGAVLDDDVARMRRLVAAESGRFPEIASTYLRESWDSNTAMLADALSQLGTRGALTVEHPLEAAEQLVWLTVGGPLNVQTLTGSTATMSSRRRRAVAQQAVRTFLSRYRGS